MRRPNRGPRLWVRMQDQGSGEGGIGGLFRSLFAVPETVEGAAASSAEYMANKLDQEATLTEFATPVPGDDVDVAFFRPLLARTTLEKRALQLAYNGERDGWDARAFHARVDGLGPGVVLACTEQGAVIGGYNPKGWVGLGEYRGSLGAFLFAWPDGDTRGAALKLRKVGGSGLAVIDEPASGPRFGADGLHIPLVGKGGPERLA